MRYCPPIYVLCVSSHLWTVPRQIKFWAILIKSWDWRDPPPPSLGQNPKFTQKKVWTAPLSTYSPFDAMWLDHQQLCHTVITHSATFCQNNSKMLTGKHVNRSYFKPTLSLRDQDISGANNYSSERSVR